MVDLKLLRADPERVRASLVRRGSNVDLDSLLALDERHRRLLSEVEGLRAEHNRAAKRIAEASGSEREVAISQARELSDRLKDVEADLDRMRGELDEALARVPNLVHPEAPEGRGEKDNAVVRQVGEIPHFGFGPRDHLDLGEALGIIDVPRAAKVSGSRFGFLKGSAAILELALIRFAIDRLTSEGFVPLIPPVLVRRQAMFGTGFFPTDEAEVYKVVRDDLYLAGTSEVPVASMHADETLPYEELPLRYAAFSSCFRREAGTYGKDTRGIIRQHQFDKVEMFSFCRADESEQEHATLLSLEEDIFASLGLTYRVVEVCAGELAAPNYRKFDVEVWLPGAERWLEVTSCSNDLDYQARRLGIRTKGAGGNELVHTLNGTAVAVGRALVAIFENHQQSDGSIRVPEALQPYAGFDAIKA